MRVGLRRSRASGGTLVELTVVLVIMGILALTQLQSGLGTLERVRRSVGAAEVNPGPAQPAQPAASPYYGSPRMTAQTQWNGGYGNPGGTTAQTESSPTVRQKMAVALHRAANWLENRPAAPAGAKPADNASHFCIGSFCV